MLALYIIIRSICILNVHQSPEKLSNFIVPWQVMLTHKTPFRSLSSTKPSWFAWCLCTTTNHHSASFLPPHNDLRIDPPPSHQSVRRDQLGNVSLRKMYKNTRAPWQQKSLHDYLHRIVAPSPLPLSPISLRILVATPIISTSFFSFTLFLIPYHDHKSCARIDQMSPDD